MQNIPAAHALHLADVAEVLGVSRERLFEAWDLSEDELEDPDRTLDLRTLRRLVATTRRLSGEEALGLLLGSRMQIANHGNLGFAVMTAPTLRACIETAIRFAPTRTRALELSLHLEDAMCAVVIEERADFGDARDVVLVALVVGIWHIAQALAGTAVVGDVEFGFPAPSYAARFSSLAPGRLRFEQPQTRLVFDAGVLDLPVRTADPAAHRRAREQCERELAQYAPADVPKLRALLGESPPPTLLEAAKRLGVSARTLKRRLRDEQTTFGEVRASVLTERAVLLLRQGRTLDEIAEQLGYADGTSFGRAFRRWTGESPGRQRT